MTDEYSDFESMARIASDDADRELSNRISRS
jgi:hypothetical protein